MKKRTLFFYTAAYVLSFLGGQGVMSLLLDARAAEDAAPRQQEEDASVQESLAEARAGDARAMLDVADCYARGRGVRQDAREADLWRRRAFECLRVRMESGDADACRELGECYMYSQGVRRDVARGLEFYHRAVEMGSAEACSSLACYYDSLAEGGRDQASALEWCLKAVEMGDQDALWSLRRYWRTPEEEKLIMESSRGAMMGYDALGARRVRADILAFLRESLQQEVPDETETVVRLCESLAEQGNARALMWLARHYQHGWEEEGEEWAVTDASEALRLYRKAAELGCAEAMFSLAEMLDESSIREEELAEMADLYRRAAELGCREAQLRLASYYRTGRGVEASAEEALAWCCRAQKQQTSLVPAYASPFRYGVMTPSLDEVLDEVLESGNLSLETIRHYAEQGMPRLQLHLASCLERGEGVEKDEAAAVRWLERAAELGNQDARFLFARRLEEGRDVPQDVARALEFYRLAVEQARAEAREQLRGDAELSQEEKEARFIDSNWEYFAEALCRLASCMEAVQGEAASRQELILLYEEAFHSDAELALSGLARLLVDEPLPEKTTERARRVELYYLMAERVAEGSLFWLQRAAEQGYEPAQTSLAQAYAEGCLVERNGELVLEWCRRAVEQDSAYACLLLAEYMLQGEVLPLDKPQAVTWFHRAVELGSTAGMVGLGYCYEMGEGVERDEAKAFRWYRAAACQRDIQGMAKLAECYQHGIGCIRHEKLAQALWELVPSRERL